MTLNHVSSKQRERFSSIGAGKRFTFILEFSSFFFFDFSRKCGKIKKIKLHLQEKAVQLEADHVDETHM